MINTGFNPYKKYRDLAIVIPTRGRDTLEQCLVSIKPANQGGYGAEVIVVIDAFELDSNEIVRIHNLVTDYGCTPIIHDAGYSDWGYPQLEHAYKQTKFVSEYVCNIGDDDVFIEGIIPKIVNILTDNPIGLFMFQAELYPSPNRGNSKPIVLWNDESRDIVRQKITGQNLFVPTISQFMGNWTDDFSFMAQTMLKWDNNVKWIPLITCKCF